jgi:shikimate dehydrogenase
VIGGRTELYGLIGWPVAHSLSPAMQNAAFAFHGRDAAYVVMPVEPSRLGEALRGAHALGVRGLNVTIPHKVEAARLCVGLDPVARATGAANVLVRTAQGWEGSNTDATAILTLLTEAGIGSGARVLLVGAGGAARAGAFAVLKAGASLRVAARREASAAELCGTMRLAAPEAALAPVAWSDLAGESRSADAILNATSVGMAGHDAALPGLAFRPGQVALDMVYGDTAFARDAQAAGARVIRGEQMLVRQGAHAFTRWTGLAAPEAVMVAALQRAREQRPE